MITDSKVKEELGKGSEISIINLLDCIIEKAEACRASDIHIDPFADSIHVRLRVDGVLQDVYEFPKNIHSEIISRIKILSRLRTDEHQATQDGRFRHLFPATGSFADIRVSIVPTYHGENAVLRILSDKEENFSLSNLGFSKSDEEKIVEALKKSTGMILATGPTGSGKTTTLYTMVKMLNSKEVSIITIEDPVEYAIDGIKQIQVNPRTSLTFANGLRSILRQDPNIIMVGEVRDAETASIAVNTALTGHLLLSTLHTNDAATTLPRLLDMGIEPYLVSSTVSIAIGQRLVRKICQSCKEKLKETYMGKVLHAGRGCEKCNGSGYLGRICINEVLVANEKIREAILRKATSDELHKIAVSSGMTPMIEDGFKKVEAGETTLEEVLRVSRN